MKLKWILYGVLGLFVLYNIAFKGSSDDTTYTTEEVVTPTKGIVTTVQQVSDSLYKIEDEQTVPTPEESLIIAKNLDNTIDTFTLDQAKLSASDTTSNSYRSSNRYIYRAVSYGLMGYMMGRSMSSPPMSSAYIDQRTYDRVNRNAGSTLHNTASRRTVSRPSSGKSGYGSSRSSRSFGG